jgi:hypothetical protein
MWKREPVWWTAIVVVTLFPLSVALVAGTQEALVLRLSVGLLLINLLIVWAVQRARLRSTVL